MQVHIFRTNASKRARYGAFFLKGGSGTSSPSSLQKNFSRSSFCFERLPAFTMEQTSCWSQTIGWVSWNLDKTDSRAVAKLSSSRAATASSSWTSWLTGSWRIFAANLEKKEPTCWAVRNSDLVKKRSPLVPFVRRISRETTSGSILWPVFCPTSNLEVRKDFCFSLKR